jgi:hypothetical protein
MKVFQQQLLLMLMLLLLLEQGVSGLTALQRSSPSYWHLTAAAAAAWLPCWQQLLKVQHHLGVQSVKHSSR